MSGGAVVLDLSPAPQLSDDFGDVLGRYAIGAGQYCLLCCALIR